MKRNALLLMVLFLTCFTLVAFADVPKTLHYQGQLRDKNGIPKADDTYTIVVKLYDSNQVQKWTGTYDVVTKNGYFELTMGDTTPQWTGLTYNEQYYIGIKVGTDPEMLPHQALNVTPYAMNVPDGSVRREKLAGWAVGTDQIEDGKVTPAKAPWAPKVYINGAAISSPKIVCIEMDVTSMVPTIFVDLSAYGFTQVPYVTADLAPSMTVTKTSITIDNSMGRLRGIIHWIIIGN